MPPLFEQAVEPKAKTDQRKSDDALGDMTAEDPSFTICTNPDSDQTIMQGMDERHLAMKADMLRSTYKVPVTIGAPQVAYREMLGCKAEIDYTYKKQIGGGGQFARVRLLFEPGAEGSGFVFESDVIGDVVPEAFIPGVLKGLQAAKDNGPLAGFPVVDFKAMLIGGGFHDMDSSVLSFEIAARGAFRELREKGAPKLLEPIMKVEVLTPEKYVGSVIGDLNARRGQIQGAESRRDAQLVTALVPLARMFGYMSQMSKISEGLAEFTSRFAHYAPVAIEPDTGPQLFPPAAAMRA